MLIMDFIFTAFKTIFYILIFLQNTTDTSCVLKSTEIYWNLLKARTNETEENSYV